MSAIRTGIVMDPIAGITPAKDSTLAMALEAQARGHELVGLELPDLHIVEGEARGRGRPLTVRDDMDDWYTLGEPRKTWRSRIWT